MGLKDLAKEKVHSRDIMMSTYEVDENHILAEGTLLEKRYRDYYKVSGEKIQSGELHNMTVRFLVKIPELIIEQTEVEMDTVPRDDCHLIKDSIEKLNGSRIAKGFTGRVKSMLSGIDGCVHLNHLVTTMASSIMQGFWAYQSSIRKSKGDIDKDTEKRRIIAMRNSLADACYAWRSDGSAVVKLDKYLKELED